MQLFARIGAFAERRAGLIVAAWLVLAVALTLSAPSLADVGVQDDTDFLPSGAPSQQADVVLQRLFPDDPTRDAAIVVVARRGGLAESDHAWLASWARETAGRPGVGGVQSAAANPAMAPLLRSPDGEAELAVVDLDVAPFTTRGHEVVADLRASLATAPAGLEHHVTGIAGLAADQAEGIQESFDRTALVTVLLVLAILVGVYRSAVAPLVPLVSIGAAFLVARGVVALLAENGLRVASMAETFMVLIVFGAGTDYCLFLVSRYREDLGRGESVGETIRRTTAVIGPVLAASAATVIVGFLAQLSAEFGLFRTMGPALAIAVAVALLAGLTLTPALLRLAGRSAFWPIRLERVRTERRETSRRWLRLASVVRARPAEVLLAGSIALLLPAAGLGWLRQSFDLVRDLPVNADARQGFDVLEQHLPGGRLSPIYVVLGDDDPILTDDKLDAVDRLTDRLRQVPGVAEVRSVTQPAGAPLTAATLDGFAGGGEGGAALGLDPNQVDVTPLYNAMATPGGLRLDATTLARYPQLRDRIGTFFLGQDANSTRLLVALEGNPYDPGAKAIFHSIDDVTARTLNGGTLSGVDLAVGGPAAFYVDIQDIGAKDTRTMGVVLFGGIFIVLALLLRSVVAPFYLLATVLASFAATLGLTVIVFQGIIGEPGISFFVTPLLFIILVALGADYNIFVTSRIREELAAGHDPPGAAAAGLVQTGRVITSAGLILAGTFAALLIAPLPNLRQMGFAVAVGILIDTFVVRTLLVPAATVLLGRWAFWPGYQRDRAERVERRHIGLAGAGVLAFGTALVVVMLTTSGTEAITRIGTEPTPSSNPTATAADPAGGPSPPVDGEPPASADSSSPSTAPEVGTPSSTAPPAEAPAPATTGISAPVVGDWRYHVEGTRRIGIAGSTQPFAEDVTTRITRVGGSDDEPEMRLLTETGSGTEDDRRRYTSAIVELLQTRRTGAGLSYGGTLEPPQQLLRYPARTGDQWQTQWTTGSVQGRSNVRVTAVRAIDIAGATHECIEVTTDSTFTGEAEGRQHDVSCWVASFGVAVTSDETMEGTFNGVPFEIHQRRTLLRRP